MGIKKNRQRSHRDLDPIQEISRRSHSWDVTERTWFRKIVPKEEAMVVDIGDRQSSHVQVIVAVRYYSEWSRRSSVGRQIRYKDRPSTNHMRSKLTIVSCKNDPSDQFKEQVRLWTAGTLKKKIYLLHQRITLKENNYVRRMSKNIYMCYRR